MGAAIDSAINAICRGCKNMLMIILAMGFGVGVIHILTVMQLFPNLLIGG